MGLQTVRSSKAIFSIKFLYAGATTVSMIAVVICMLFLNIDKIYPQIAEGLKAKRERNR